MARSGTVAAMKEGGSGTLQKISLRFLSLSPAMFVVDRLVATSLRAQ